jgi:agmatinase
MPANPFDPNGPGSSHHNIFGLPFSEEQARVVLLPVPWEVTVSYKSGTARGPEHIFQASRQIDIPDEEEGKGWKSGFFMRQSDKHLLARSDYYRKQSELYINFLAEGGNVDENPYLKNCVGQINEECKKMNGWVYHHAKDLLDSGKLVGLVGGDHSTALGLFRAVGHKYGDFGILQIDAHCDLRKAYHGFTYSHASIMFNALQ